MTTPDPARWPDLYRAGLTLAEVAQLVDADESTVRRALAKAGVERRHPGSQPNRDIPTSRIIALREAGLGWRRIGQQVGMSDTGAYRRYHRAMGCTCPGQGPDRCEYCHEYLQPT
jgi:hypothetical protein